ncbi:MAG: tRNA epoxyqueuosine(34) reductase QueG [Gracilimonas sp.]|uniref:tRNA epoxyqueuosine(34) reductase QueG n=1 Tax=Gracilimonas TaxID=649462 RepID=UPI001AFF0328|nr:tRNA epoxyqueuosine(34) reductase QueG [Gracilimonas sp.]MBO6586252.1 tRNA epoxyqueuosine(34) reductase QueG [Gracilimonas sp.]MBO6614909.1 tRNA epoxyqueuosine(34) reductase QueG [Gracilimonas sp.]
MLQQKKFTEQIRSHALQLGFDACGFAEAQHLPHEARRLEEWLKQNRNGTMDWMGNYFEKRVDPTLLVPGSKTVVSVLASYYHPSHHQQIGEKNEPLIAKYAQGRDYHKVLKKKLKKLFNFSKELLGGLEGRIFVDSAPVLDKVWAKRAGLGWIGKNSNLLNKDIGSFVFIGEMIIDAELSYDSPVTDHCGSCTRCLDACPTDAIYEPYRVDATKCISYLTIELKEEIDKQYQTDIENWVYGCDICQDVCPWNSKSITAQFEDLYPRDYVVERDLDFWENLTPQQYDETFEGSAIRRAKYDKFKSNVEIVSGNISN